MDNVRRGGEILWINLTLVIEPNRPETGRHCTYDVTLWIVADIEAPVRFKPQLVGEDTEGFRTRLLRVDIRTRDDPAREPGPPGLDGLQRIPAVAQDRRPNAAAIEFVDHALGVGI